VKFAAVSSTNVDCNARGNTHKSIINRRLQKRSTII